MIPHRAATDSRSHAGAAWDRVHARLAQADAERSARLDRLIAEEQDTVRAEAASKRAERRRRR
jgi:hypothetical protein